MARDARKAWPGAPAMAGISHYRQAQRATRAHPPEWWITGDDPQWAARCVQRHARDGAEETALLEMLGISDG